MLLEVRRPGARISLRNGLLEILPGGESDASAFRIPPGDVTRLVLETPRATVSAAALVALAEHGVSVLLCDNRHAPAAEIGPALGAGSGARAQLIRAQVLLRADTRDRLWKRIVQAKIVQQAEALEDVGAKASAADRLRRLMHEVRSGDPDNREAAAAQVYWPALLGRDFLRGAEEQALNAGLNYGYAVLRSLMLRALHEAGPHPAFGIHHISQDNPGNLADDLLEPYRPAVDRLIHHWAPRLSEEGLTPELKLHLAELPNYPVRLGGQTLRLSNAVLETCRSHAAILRRDKRRHVLPEHIEEAGKCPTPGAPCG